MDLASRHTGKERLMVLVNDFWTFAFTHRSPTSPSSVWEQKGNDVRLLRTPALHSPSVQPFPVVQRYVSPPLVVSL